MSFAAGWLEYFERNRLRRVAFPELREIYVPRNLGGPLVRSLQRFQIGEQGDGAHLRRAATSAGDSAYSAAIEMFVKEEQEHARILASVLTALGAPLLSRHWSDACFTMLRRLLGLRWEILVLMIAELIGRRYYQLLHEQLPVPALRPIFGQIMRDEVGHIAFHTEFLQRAFGSQPLPLRLLVCATWWLFFRCVCQVVAWDHGALLRALNIPAAQFKSTCLADADALLLHLVAGPTADAAVRSAFSSRRSFLSADAPAVPPR